MPLPLFISYEFQIPMTLHYLESSEGVLASCSKRRSRRPLELNQINQCFYLLLNFKTNYLAWAGAQVSDDSFAQWFIHFFQFSIFFFELTQILSSLQALKSLKLSFNFSSSPSKQSSSQMRDFFLPPRHQGITIVWIFSLKLISLPLKKQSSSQLRDFLLPPQKIGRRKILGFS